MNGAVTTGLMPFHAMEMVARAKALEAAGRTICHLEVGEPAAPPAPRVREAVAAALSLPQGYTNSMGLLSLRQKLARSYTARREQAVDPDNVVVTMGSSAAFILAFLAGFGAGARIAVTRPGYPAYLNIIAGLGLVAVEIPVRAADGWRLAPGALAAAHARQPFDGLLFASPANPTGASVPPDVFAEIVGVCARLGVRLISDEIYHGLDYGVPAASALAFTDEAIIINSFSKYYCMTGWRVGWMVLPPPLVRKAVMLQQSLFISAPTLSQIAAEAALGERDYYEAEKARYRRNEAVLTQGLQELGFRHVRPADGAFYSYVGIGDFAEDSMQFCRDLVEKAGVAATPGIDFDRADGGKFMRFSYAGAEVTITEALERLRRFLRWGG